MISQPYDPANPHQTGCILDYPNEAYHASKDSNGFPYVSTSKLFTFHKRPRLFQGQYVTAEVERPTTEALVTGSGSHAFVLESEESFKQQFTCLEGELNWRGASAKMDSIIRLADAKGIPLGSDQAAELAAKKKDEIEQWFHAAPGKTILTKEQFDLIKIIREQVHNHKEAAELLSSGVAECTFRTPQLKLGYSIQCRFDWLNVDGCWLGEGRAYGADLKTVASLDRWNKEFLNRGYYRAYPFYALCQKSAVGKRVIDEWYWIVAEKEWPYAVMVVHPSPECWERGLAEITKDMEALGECIKNNHYPDPGDGGITEQQLPEFMLTGAPAPGIKTGPKYEPVRNYEYQEGWEKES